jgi:hypothetical protein
VLEKPVGTSGLELFRDARRGVGGGSGGETGVGGLGGHDGDGKEDRFVKSQASVTEVDAVGEGKTKSAGDAAGSTGRKGNERTLERWKGPGGVELRAKGPPASLEGGGGGGSVDGKQ